MDNKDRQEMENKAFDEMRKSGKKLEESRQNKNNDNDVNPQGGSRLWVWLGVLVLIFILIYWLFAIGTFGDLMDWFNG